MFLIADLTNEPIKTGFHWGKSGANTKIIRPTDKPIWIVEKRVKQGFLSRLFGGKKIPELMKGLGGGIKEFKKATKEEEDASKKVEDSKE